MICTQQLVVNYTKTEIDILEENKDMLVENEQPNIEDTSTIHTTQSEKD